MKNFKKLTILGSLAAMLFMATACDLFEIEPEDNPNALTPVSASPDFYLTSIELGVRAFHGTMNNINADLVRQTHFYGPTYLNGFTPTTFNGVWSTAYATILEDVNALITLAEERDLFMHAAIAKILKSYVMTSMVDMFGNVPYTEANDANILNPSVDDGATIYAAAKDLLDSAIADLGQNNVPIPAVDLFYGGSVANWVSLANTLKIRINVNSRLSGGSASEVNSILAGGQIIDTKAEDFQFRYSTNQANPDSRHPDFGGNYDAQASEYISQDYMARFINWSSGQYDGDPRLRFYFYRQTNTDATPTSGADLQARPCMAQDTPAHYSADDPFCNYLMGGRGYWGRDHGDADGIPPDGLSRTTWGLYPVGGKLDADDDANVSQLGNLAAGAQGAGVEPIYLSSFTHFMLAEAALTMGTSGDAGALLEAGIRQSIDKVINFGSEIGYSYSDAEAAFVPDGAYIDAYVNDVMASYNAAGAAGKLAIVIEELHKATWGNGLEMFNAYRRTGYPSRMQPTLTNQPGPFIRSYLYPLDHITRNSNANQKSDWIQKVFWDTNSDALN